MANEIKDIASWQPRRISTRRAFEKSEVMHVFITRKDWPASNDAPIADWLTHTRWLEIQTIFRKIQYIKPLRDLPHIASLYVILWHITFP